MRSSSTASLPSPPASAARPNFFVPPPNLKPPRPFPQHDSPASVDAPDESRTTPRQPSRLPMGVLLARHRAQTASSSSPAPASDCGGTLLPPVPERVLLRDILYIFQGIDGQFVRFKTPTPRRPGPKRTFVRGEIVTETRGIIDPVDRDDQGTGQRGDAAREEDNEFEDGIEFVDLKNRGYSLAAPTRSLLHQLSELGWLYRKIESALLRSEQGRGHLVGARGRKGTKTRQQKESTQHRVGMIEQSLHAELQREVTNYFALVAALESKLDVVAEEEDEEHEDARLADVGDASSSGLGDVRGLTGTLSLRKLDVWTQDIRLRMRMMGTLVSEIGGKLSSFLRIYVRSLTDTNANHSHTIGSNVGGAFLTTLHSYTANGDPFIRNFSSRLLKTLSVPFFSTLSSWIYQGELRDPYSEFFVELNPALGHEGDERWKRRGGNVVDGDYWVNSFDDERGVPSHELWADKFAFRKEMLPGFLEESFGRKVSRKVERFGPHTTDDAGCLARFSRRGRVSTS